MLVAIAERAAGLANGVAGRDVLHMYPAGILHSPRPVRSTPDNRKAPPSTLSAQPVPRATVTFRRMARSGRYTLSGRREGTGMRLKPRKQAVAAVAVATGMVMVGCSSDSTERSDTSK